MSHSSENEAGRDWAGPGTPMDDIPPDLRDRARLVNALNRRTDELEAEIWLELGVEAGGWETPDPDRLRLAIRELSHRVAVAEAMRAETEDAWAIVRSHRLATLTREDAEAIAAEAYRLGWEKALKTKGASE